MSLSVLKVRVSKVSEANPKHRRWECLMPSADACSEPSAAAAAAESVSVVLPSSSTPAMPPVVLEDSTIDLSSSVDGGSEAGSIDVEDVGCSICQVLESTEDNDVVICDRFGCFRAFHVK